MRITARGFDGNDYELVAVIEPAPSATPIRGPAVYDANGDRIGQLVFRVAPEAPSGDFRPLKMKGVTF
jgi:hypothetical protein